MANSMVWVPEGGMLQITNRILQAEAQGASASEIIYKITQDHPQFGNFFLPPLSLFHHCFQQSQTCFCVMSHRKVVFPMNLSFKPIPFEERIIKEFYHTVSISSTG